MNTGIPGDSVGSVPDHHNKANIATNHVMGIFLFPSGCIKVMLTP